MRVGSPATETAGPLIGSPSSLAAVLVVAVASVVPTGIAGASATLAPHLALAAIFVLAADAGRSLGPVGAYLAGLTVDVLTACPLGICAAAYLVFFGLVAHEAAVLRELPHAGRILVFVVLAAGVGFAQAAAIVAVGGSRPSATEFALSLAAASAVYPVAAAVLGRRRPRRRSALRSLGR